MILNSILTKCFINNTLISNYERTISSIKLTHLHSSQTFCSPGKSKQIFSSIIKFIKRKLMANSLQLPQYIHTESDSLLEWRGGSHMTWHGSHNMYKGVMGSQYHAQRKKDSPSYSLGHISDFHHTNTEITDTVC